MANKELGNRPRDEGGRFVGSNPTTPNTTEGVSHEAESGNRTVETNTKIESNGKKGMSRAVKNALGIAGIVSLLGVSGAGGYALIETGKHAGDKKQETPAVLVTTTETTGQAAADPKTNTGETITQNTETTVFVPTSTTTSEVSTTTTTTVVERNLAVEMGPVGAIIPVPSVISGDMVREVRDRGANKLFSEGEWFHPVYDIGAEDEAHEYRGIGPWYPVAFANLDENAAKLTTHGNVGELVVQGNEGGRVMVAFMQLDAHQTEGAWGTDPETGRFMQNDAWEMQYNFHSLAPYQELFVVDPDTGEGYTWEDGTPVIYRANEQGIAAFAIPKTQGEDVRVGFVFEMPAKTDGVQVPEVKIERGPNDRPGLTGENPLPGTVKKPMVPEK